MDASWNSSQWVSIHHDADISPTHINNTDDDDDDDDDDSRLPQVDGLTDKKSTPTYHCLAAFRTSLCLGSLAVACWTGDHEVAGLTFGLTTLGWLFTHMCLCH